MSAETRFKIVGDNSGHEYYIPAEHVDDWEAFCGIPDDDGRGWEVPAWATRIDGRFTFTVTT